MAGFDLSLDDFAYLVRVASRHHLKEIAGWLSLTTRRRREAIVFLDEGGREVTLAEAHRLCQADPQLMRWAYNLFMSYAR